MSPPTVEKDKSIPSFATANAAAETAYRAAAAAAERLRSEDEGGSKPATNATNASWAQRPSSKAGTGNATKPSPKVFPERDGFNAGRARRSSPVNEGGWDFCMGIGWNFYDYVSATLCNWMDILVYSLCWPSCPLLFWPCSSTTFWLGSLWQGQGMTLDSTDNVKFPKNGCENCSLSSNMSMMLQSVDILYIYIPLTEINHRLIEYSLYCVGCSHSRVRIWPKVHFEVAKAMRKLQLHRLQIAIFLQRCVGTDDQLSQHTHKRYEQSMAWIWFDFLQRLFRYIFVSWVVKLRLISNTFIPKSLTESFVRRCRQWRRSCMT